MQCLGKTEWEEGEEDCYHTEWKEATIIPLFKKRFKKQVCKL